MKRTRRRTTTTRSRTNLHTINPPHNISAFSFPENEMTSLGLFASSSSSSSSTTSSNLSPLALPFTVERSNHNKFNLCDTHFNFNGKSDTFWSTSPNFQSSTTAQGLVADSLTTATVPSTYSTFPNPNPNPNTAASTNHNRSSIPAINVSAIGPNQRVSFSSPFNASTTHNWSSSVKSALGPIKPPVGKFSFGMINPNTQPDKWSLGNDNDASVTHLDFNLLPSRDLLQDYGSSQVSYNQNLPGSKYSGQADGSRGKEEASLFGGVFGGGVTRENNSIGPSVFGKSHEMSSTSATCHGIVSSGFSDEHTFTWEGCTSHYPFETRSIFYDSSSDQLSPSLATKSMDIRSTSPFTKNSGSVSHKSLNEKESYHAVGFDYKSSLNSQVPEIHSIEEVNSAANLSEHLDHHNPGEDSPCWKGAPTHFTSSGSQEQESSQHTMKKLQENSGEDVLLNMDQSLHGVIENAVNVVTSESLDVNMVVKALINLSELLLGTYSKDECRLKDQDVKAIDRVIANLNVCMSSKIQQVNPAQNCSSSQQINANMLREERNNYPLGKNIEEPQSAYVRDEGVQKDYNMIQKIKSVLDENLEFKEDLPSDPLLYKNLWLEAEAELCVSSYKSRLHRAKREMGKSKARDLSEAPSDIKKISSSILSPTAPKLFHEVASSKKSNTHAPLPIVDDDDAENSVMARFNILKRREESNPVNMAEKEPADVDAFGYKVQSSGVAEGPHSQHLLDTDDVLVMHSHGKQKMQGSLAKEDVEHAVMARLNILKLRGEGNRLNAEEDVRADDGGHAQVSEEGVVTSTAQNQFGSFSAYNASSFGWEYVLDG
ncbi:hypothetical protein QVD17_30881 [Tagetes erecta]|uniref:Uncharacterized protein n=1 Tax=Tagetes erecta TaxID=13708 RepID=A0AAD8NGF8_TARER|nr:hypothetical protein QVD17_30881 [Tagetes erecta]